MCCFVCFVHFLLISVDWIALLPHSPDPWHVLFSFILLYRRVRTDIWRLNPIPYTGINLFVIKKNLIDRFSWCLVLNLMRTEKLDFQPLGEKKWYPKGFKMRTYIAFHLSHMPRYMFHLVVPKFSGILHVVLFWLKWA